MNPRGLPGMGWVSLPPRLLAWWSSGLLLAWSLLPGLRLPSGGLQAPCQWPQVRPPGTLPWASPHPVASTAVLSGSPGLLHLQHPHGPKLGLGASGPRDLPHPAWGHFLRALPRPHQVPTGLPMAHPLRRAGSHLVSVEGGCRVPGGLTQNLAHLGPMP